MIIGKKKFVKIILDVEYGGGINVENKDNSSIFRLDIIIVIILSIRIN